MPSRFLYFPHDRLSPAELTAACLDGHLIALGEGFVPADTIETVSLRAASIAPVVGEHRVATLTSAAWVWGALVFPPARHHAARSGPARSTAPIGGRMVLHDVAVAPHDTVRIAGIGVTSPARTLADLMRWGGDADGEWSAAARAMIGWGVDIDAAREALVRHRRLPGKRRALMLLDRLQTSQDDVTR